MSETEARKNSYLELKLILRTWEEDIDSWLDGHHPLRFASPSVRNWHWTRFECIWTDCQLNSIGLELRDCLKLWCLDPPTTISALPPDFLSLHHDPISSYPFQGSCNLIFNPRRPASTISSFPSFTTWSYRNLLPLPLCPHICPSLSLSISSAHLWVSDQFHSPSLIRSETSYLSDDRLNGGSTLSFETFSVGWLWSQSTTSGLMTSVDSPGETWRNWDIETCSELSAFPLFVSA